MRQKHHFQLLDIYRGIAALFVVAYHITTEMWYKFNHYIFLGNVFKFGNIGVDFFFVLSGFVIFYIHQKDTSADISTFFTKRFIRIYPSYWVIVTIVLIVYMVLGRFIIDKPQLSISYIFSTYTLFPHIFRLIPPSWTLTEEVWFYLFFGTLLFIPSIKVRLGIFSFIASVLFAASFFISYSPIKEALITPSMIEFVVGCIAGYVFSYISQTIHKMQFLYISILSLLFLALAMNIPILFLHIPLTALSLGVFVWATGALEASYKLGLHKILLLIGNASYVIYLMHAFIIKILLKVVYPVAIKSHNQLLLVVIGVFVFVVCTYIPTLCYKYFEKPMLLYLRKNYLRKRG